VQVQVQAQAQAQAQAQVQPSCCGNGPAKHAGKQCGTHKASILGGGPRVLRRHSSLVRAAAAGGGETKWVRQGLYRWCVCCCQAGRAWPDPQAQADAL
jgi:hypothetical protein